MVLRSGIEMAIAVVLVSVLSRTAAAQSGCTSVLIGMAPCLSYVSGNSSTPSSSCCSQLSSVVRSPPQCLCTVLNIGAILGVKINQTPALALLGACNVQTPPVSRCNAANGPASSPVTSPAEAANGPASSPITSPAGSPEASPSDSSTSSSESGAGSKTVPTAGASTSNGATFEMPLHLVLLISIFMAAYSSTCCSF